MKLRSSMGKALFEHYKDKLWSKGKHREAHRIYEDQL